MKVKIELEHEIFKAFESFFGVGFLEGVTLCTASGPQFVNLHLDVTNTDTDIKSNYTNF